MINQLPIHQGRAPYLCFLIVLSLLLLACGCTQAPAARTGTTGLAGSAGSAGSTATLADEAPVVIVDQPDASHIQITYHGSLNTDKLIELEVSITDSNGKVTTQSMGSLMATTPIPYGSSRTITGSFDGKDQVFVTGYFSDGSQKPMIDTKI
ncbi:MAG: hypothetical protein WCF90_07685 [Methanomicrobiales archaeon]